MSETQQRTDPGPHPADAFASTISALDLDRALIVLDTNTLLLPYAAGTDSLADIAKVYRLLELQGRLLVPAQVALEYRKNRAARISEIYKSLGDAVSKATTAPQHYPLLASLPEYATLLESERRLLAAQEAFRDSLKAVQSRIRGWAWSDPVREAYSQIFTREVVAALQLSDEDLERERKRRYEQKRPPGYKDAAKDDGGGGDLAIWLTILQESSKRGCDAVLVSSDEKADWYQQSAGAPLFTRWELLEEFRTATNGRCFRMMRLSKLLEHLSIPGDSIAPRTIEEVRRTEDVSHEVPLARATRRLRIRLATLNRWCRARRGRAPTRQQPILEDLLQQLARCSLEARFCTSTEKLAELVTAADEAEAALRALEHQKDTAPDGN